MATRPPLLREKQGESRHAHAEKCQLHSCILAGAWPSLRTSCISRSTPTASPQSTPRSITSASSTLPEKITRVAAGSEAMQIEWHENNVFIKPLKGGQSTNLMVWTEHQFSTYELEAPGDVKQMTFVTRRNGSPRSQSTTRGGSPAAAEAVRPKRSSRMTDSVIGSTLLQVTPVVPRGVRPAKGPRQRSHQRSGARRGFSLRALRGDQQRPAAISDLSPNVFTITPQQNAELLPSMKDVQITEQTISQFQSNQTAQVTVRGTDTSPEGCFSGSNGRRSIDNSAGGYRRKPGVYRIRLRRTMAITRIKATAVL